jgi:hypothetical protein
MTAAVVAIMVRREREVVEAYRRAGATTPATAISPAELRLDDGAAIQRLRRRAVLRETESGSYYLDEPSWEALHGIRHRFVAVMLIIVALAAVLGLALGGVVILHP